VLKFPKKLKTWGELLISRVISSPDEKIVPKMTQKRMQKYIPKQIFKREILRNT